ncbi:hypothetical protein [Enterococcus durans]|uniref:Uncharacterized protein n=1 Tax=Enterococcus durans TaxID=53345 RepID=A0A377KKA7_9ENTE|nr:hypothetical protein [Enterococcus durans]STP29610.1 Uncharacterised protein [Enterococcus durans]
MYYHVNERDTKKVINLLSGIENRQTDQHFLENTKEVKLLFTKEALVRHILYQNELEIVLDSEEQNYIGLSLENNYRSSICISFVHLTKDTRAVFKNMLSYIEERMRQLFVKEVNKLLIDLDRENEFFSLWEGLFLDSGFSKCTLSNSSKVVTYEYLF